jgi:hypothetical protein
LKKNRDKKVMIDSRLIVIETEIIVW